MAALFEIYEHVINGQHIREYPRATARSQEEVLQLAVKQYVPKDNPNPNPGDITILASHANGFVKELYEPLWDDLLHACRQHGVNIRGIWIADVAWQGQSGVLNEDKLGNDPSWLDHARDLLQLTNVFRAQMPRPLIGVGHSFGATILANLALMHPRLFCALVMIDPTMSRTVRLGPLYGFNTMRASASRRDLWPSRADAERSVRQNKFYASWDPRCIERLLQFGYRDCPTKIYPGLKAGEVTLTTPKHQESFTYYRPTHLGPYDAETGKRSMDQELIRDAPDDMLEFPHFHLYQSAGPMTAARMSELRPGVLWISGETSQVCTPEIRREKMESTGYGCGGSGGAKAGRVKEFVVEGTGHLVPMQKPNVVAGRAAVFIRDEVDRWRREEEVYRREWVEGVGEREKQIMSLELTELIAGLGPEANRRRDGNVADPDAKL